MPLLTAAKNNDWETVNQLFQDVASLEARGATGRSLLHWAAIHGRSDFLERHRDLLREDLVNTADQKGNTPLHLAARHGHWSCVEQLMIHGAKFNTLNIDASTPLHYAVRNGQLEFAQQFTQHILLTLLPQRPEHGALLHAFNTLHSYHHRQTRAQFFIQAQESHIATERQKQAAALLQASAKGKDQKEEEEIDVAVEPLSENELNVLFQKSQLQQALNQFDALLKNLPSNDPLIPFILWARSETFLQETYKSNSYENAMRYAASAVAHYQKFVKNTPQDQPDYEALIISQENRIIIIYCKNIFEQRNAINQVPLSKYRQKISDHRNELRQDIEEKALPDLLKKNTDFFKKLTVHLWKKSLELRGQAPTPRYAIASLGSMARQEMSPYSDLEFVLLLEEDEDFKTKKIFESTVRLMSLLVIGLGETPTTIPCIAPFSATVKGYNFDEGGNTPLHEECMDTPQFLAERQYIEHNPVLIMRSVFRTTTFLYGHEPLQQDYQNRKLRKVLSERFGSLSRRQAQALEALTDTLNGFSSSHLSETPEDVKECNSLNIKTDLYRLPSQVIENLALYYDISSNTTFERIKQLKKKNIIHPENAKYLTELMEMVLSLRYKTHLYYRMEREDVVLSANNSSIYVLSDKERTQLLQIFRILLALESALKKFVDTQGRSNPFATSILYSEDVLAKNEAFSHHLAARQYEYTSTPEQALSSYKKALRLDPDNQEIHIHYVRYLSSLYEMFHRRQAAYETLAVQHVTQLVSLLLLQKLPSNGFDMYYQALPLSWRPIFRNAFNKNNPLHNAILIRLTSLDHQARDNPQQATQDSQAAQTYFTAKASPLLPESKEEVPDATSFTLWSGVQTALTNPTLNDGAQCFLIMYGLFAALPPMVALEVKQAEHYQCDIQRELLDIVMLLLASQKGIQEIEPFLAYYRRLPFPIRPLFRQVILSEQDKMQDNAKKNFFGQLLKTLNEEPDATGERESWQQHKDIWKKTLNNLVSKETAKEGRVCLVSPLLDREGQAAVKYPLKPKVQSKLLDEELEFRPSIINGSQHDVVPLDIKQADGSSRRLYCKAYPEMPGMTYLIERLHHRLIGHGTCFSELVKIERPGKTPLPVLISEGIPGLTLHDVLKQKGPQYLEALDHDAYSELVFLAILTNPEDGLPTNYIVREHSDGRLTLESVDHDHALFPPYRLELDNPHKEAADSKDGEDEQKGEQQKQGSFSFTLQVKTILFCLNAMKDKPVGKTAREKFLHIDPAKVLSRVLREAQIQNTYYESLFDEDTIKQFHENRQKKSWFPWRAAKNDARTCTIPVPLKKGDAIKLYQKICQLKDFLNKHRDATLLQCLIQIEPRVGMAYADAIRDFENPLERLLHLGKYPVIQGQMVSHTQALTSLAIDKTRQYVKLEDLTPEQGLAELDVMTYQQSIIDEIRQEVLQGDLGRFLALEAPEHKAWVISGMPLNAKESTNDTLTHTSGIDWGGLKEAIQRKVFAALGDVPFTQLNLSGCHTLSKKQLINLLVQSPDCTELNLSGHLTLDDTWLPEIAKHAKHLRVLTIRNAPHLKHIRNLDFYHLVNLDVAQNGGLQTLEIKAPRLKFLQTKQCPTLTTITTASKQLVDVDCRNNTALTLSSKLGHTESSYTLNRLQLSGCRHMENHAHLSDYPFALISPLDEADQKKLLTFLDQTIGKKGWLALSKKQRKRITLSFFLEKYVTDDAFSLFLNELENQDEASRKMAYEALHESTKLNLLSPSIFEHTIKFFLLGLKDQNEHVRLEAYRSLSVLVTNPYLSSAKIDEALQRLLTHTQDENKHVRATVYRIIGNLATNPNCTESIIERIWPIMLQGTEDNEDNVRAATYEALAVNLKLSSMQRNEIWDALFRDIKHKEWTVQAAAYKALNTLITHPNFSHTDFNQMIKSLDDGVESIHGSVLEEVYRGIGILSVTPKFSDDDGVDHPSMALLLAKAKNNRYIPHMIFSVLTLNSNTTNAFVADLLEKLLSDANSKEPQTRENLYENLSTLAANAKFPDLLVSRLLEALLTGVQDKSRKYKDARAKAYNGLSALAANQSLSGIHLTKMSQTLLMGVIDKYDSVQVEAYRSLGALIVNPHLPDASLNLLLEALFTGATNKNSNIRVAVYESFSILITNPRFFDLLTHRLLDALLFGIKDENLEARMVAYKILNTGLLSKQVVRPFLARRHISQILDAILSNLKDFKKIPAIAKVSVCESLGILGANLHLTDTQIHSVLKVLLTVMTVDKDENMQKAVQNAFIYLAHHCPVDHLPFIVTSINYLMQSENQRARSISAFMRSILLTRFSLLPYLNTLQAERVQKSAIHAELAPQNLYQQLEARMVVLDSDVDEAAAQAGEQPKEVLEEKDTEPTIPKKPTEQRLVRSSRFFMELTTPSSQQPVQRVTVPEEFICPISKDIMEHPVTLLDDGRDYEEWYLKTYLETTRNPISPVIGVPLAFKQYRPNEALKARIAAFYDQFPLLRNAIGPTTDERYALFVARQQDEMTLQKQRLLAPFFTHLQRIKDYLEKCGLLGLHKGPNNYDVFISYAWQDKHNMKAHTKLQEFLIRIHDDLQMLGLDVFLDCKDMDRNMPTVMEECIRNSGIIFTICNRFLQETVRDKPESNIALEVDCTLARGLQESKALQPLLCEDEWNNALPLQIRDNVSLKLGQDTCQDARDVFAGFDYHQPFSVTYMNWMVNHLIPRVMRNTGIPSDDLLLASLIQLFHTERQLPEHIAHMTPHEQFEHNYPNSSPEQRTEIGLKAFEFLLRRLQELTTFHQKHVDVPDAKEPRTIMREILLIAPSCPSRELMDWTIQFSRHLENAGLKVSLWSGHGDLPQPIPCAVITVCTPELKNTVEAGLEQLASVWGQLQHHLAKPDVVCFPIIYEGDYGTAVPNWSKNYHSPWPKNFLARNTDGNSLALSQSHYYKLMIGIKPKGLLRDLLDYRDNDPCYNLLLHIFQRMRAGWGTKELLVLEEASLAKAGIQVQVNDASVQNHAVCL